MSEKKELTNFQKFLLWFLPTSSIITIVSFLIFAIWIPNQYTIYAMAGYPLIISSIEGSLGTYFYFQNRKRKVTLYAVLFLILTTIIAIYVYYINLPKGKPLTYPDIFGTGLLWIIAALFYVSGNAISSSFVSKLVKPHIPKKHEIQSNLLYYKFKDHDENEIIKAFDWFLFQIFNYNITKKENEDGKHLTLFLNCSGGDKYIFVYIDKNEKSILLLPITLSSFIEYSCNEEEKQIIKSFLSVFYKVDSENITDMQLTKFVKNFEETIKPISKSTLETIKTIILPCIITIILVGVAVGIILNFEGITNFLKNIDTVTIIGMVIAGVMSSLLTLSIIGGGKRITNAIKRKLGKK